MPLILRAFLAAMSVSVLAALGPAPAVAQTRPAPADASCPADGEVSVANVYVCRGADLIDASFFATRKEVPGDARGVDTRPAPDPAAPAGARSSGEPVREDAPSTVRKSTGTAYVERALLWTWDTKGATRDVDGRLRIEVCWINPTDSPGEREGRELTRTAVEETWHAHVRFVGWGGCVPDDTGGVRILISDEGPRAWVGRVAGTASPSMWLNFTFRNWSRDCANRDERVSPITWDRCVYSIAVHEFGHVLGFYHEHDRLFHGVAYHQLPADELASRKAECAARNETAATDPNPPSDPLITFYDPRSVMNYCFEIYDHRVTLSNADVRGVRMAYGQ
jgi:hypothetical protein